ncbi:acetoacetate decarboxylase family protein [Roseomonas genomospecies 6]|uniref:Acetoacetate decarboxylase n=1 Tax=Roseomonas genomospecies 6 TaxID=214106 RepID=A0A9W7NJN0_9PROT|nr:acetoacetate decarboxylase family protein [Roseomonas genomospecies 6]KAA0680635.1 hypothetical protein DS843_12400 [Roseomonas genomospecies 6]
MTGPRYISFAGHGEVSIAAPGVFADSLATAFVVRSNPVNTQALVDKLLNAAPAGAVRYTVAGPVALCTFLSVGRCTSPTEPFGWIPYREASLWLPLIEHRPGQWPRLVLWMPYVFPDATIPLVCGREGWGFAKSLGRVTLPEEGAEAPHFVCETTLFRTLSSDCEGVLAPLLTVEGGPWTPGSAWKSLEDLGADLGDALKSLLRPGGLVEGVEVAVKAVESLLAGTVPVINLKQFRDAPDSERACYQALIDCPMHVDRFRGAWPMRGDWTLRVADYASHQVISDFGFEAGPDGSAAVHVDFAMQIHMDFRANPGRVVWQAE